MMAHKQLLHELLKEDQEPFQLQSYISDRRSQLKKPSSSTTLQLRKRKPAIAESSTKRSNFAKHACFFSFQNSPDVRKSPFRDFPVSPAKSPCKSPKAAVFLHIPSGTAAHLVEAAMRIQRQQQSKPKSQNLGFGLFGSFLKRLKDRSKNNKKRAIVNHDLRVLTTKREQTAEEPVRISSFSNRRLSSASWTDNNEDVSMDFEASTSGYGSDCSEDVISDFDFPETRFCSSPFVFSFPKSPSSNGRRTPDFCSPVPSPGRPTKKEKENYESRNSDEALGQEDEEKEQCSPVSVLDPPFEDDDGRESGDVEADEYVLECSYANVQRAKEQLLHRLQRFEKLAELDPFELEKKLLEGSDDDFGGGEEFMDDETYLIYRQPEVETSISETFSESSLQFHSVKMPSEPVVEERNEFICPSSQGMVVSRISSGLDSWKEVGLNTIEMMIAFDLHKEPEGWTKFPGQVDDTAEDIELAIFRLLLEELSEELVYMDGKHQELKFLHLIHAH